MKKRTDVQGIEYSRGLSKSDRQHCRRMILAVADFCSSYDVILASCSAGIDSTVMAHALSQAIRIRPNNQNNQPLQTTAVYLNHGLRPEQVAIEAAHVYSLSSALAFRTPPVDLSIPLGPALQERARKARYEALEGLAKGLAEGGKRVLVCFGHNKNDQVETKLLQFLKGKPVTGIPYRRQFVKNLPMTKDLHHVDIGRPLLPFSREDIEKYASSFKISWWEDSSNETDKYTRNKIRHHLIPWIQDNVNSGLINSLGTIG